MSWWRPWTWWHRPADGRAAALAEQDARRKLAEAERQAQHTRAAVTSFEAAVEIALQRRRR